MLVIAVPELPRRRTARSLVLLALCLCLGVVRASAAPPAGGRPTVVLYSEAIAYRSRVERSLRYVRMVDLLVEARRERMPNKELAHRMELIANPGMDREWERALLGLLGYTPSYYGRGVKALLEFDGAKEKLQKIFGRPSPSIRAGENVVASLEYLQREAEKDPEFKEKQMSFLEKEFGDLNGTPAGVLTSSPAFADHKKVQALSALEGDVSKLKDEAAQAAEELKKLREEAEADRRAQRDEAQRQQTYEERERRISEAEIYGRLVGRLIAFKNPELGRQVGVVVDSGVRVARVLNAVGAGLMSGGAGAANLGLVAMDMVGSLSGAKSPETMILEQLGAIQEQIQKSTEAILESLEIAHQKLDEILRLLTQTYREVLRNQDLLLTLHEKVDRLDLALSNDNALILQALRVGASRPLASLAFRTLGHRELFEMGAFRLDERRFQETILELATWATVNASDTTAVPTPALRSTASEDLSRQLDMLPLDANLEYVSRCLRERYAVSVPSVDFDIPTWALACEALCTLIDEYPEYRHDVRATFLSKLRERGDRFLGFVSQCGPRVNRPVYDRMVKEAVEESGTLSAALSQALRTRMSELLVDRYRGELKDPDTIAWSTVSGSNPSPVLERFRRSIPARGDFGPGSVGRVNTETDPEPGAALVPSELRAAWCLNFVRVEVRHKRRVEQRRIVNGNTASDGEHVWDDVSLTASFRNEQSGADEEIDLRAWHREFDRFGNASSLPMTPALQRSAVLSAIKDTVEKGTLSDSPAAIAGVSARFNGVVQGVWAGLGATVVRDVMEVGPGASRMRLNGVLALIETLLLLSEQEAMFGDDSGIASAFQSNGGPGSPSTWSNFFVSRSADQLDAGVKTWREGFLSAMDKMVSTSPPSRLSILGVTETVEHLAAVEGRLALPVPR